jgi:hypothetical protein
MPPKLCLAVVLFAASCAWSQQPAHKALTVPAKSGTSTLPKTSPELIKVIQRSYYHPDNLELIECDLSVDWDKFFQRMKMNVPEEKLRSFNTMKIHSRALRGKPVEIKFDWAGGVGDAHDRIESGLKQTLNGFYQMYWPMMAGPLIAGNDHLEQIVSLPDGGVKASAISGGMKIHMMLDREGVPTHYEFEGGMMKGLVDLAYSPSPNSVPGDLRRIEDMQIDEQIGESSVKLDTKVDYQDVNGFMIPRTVILGMPGAYTFNFEFSGCTASAVAVSQ